ncbi:uncharacterized protein LOC113359252 [Papaver somniferum]|uniref:uncharacterized protein LOC113359252 n=1 Tax=Papaver somniferum TaxID=3469 RepID=UPI000E6FF2A6|nr:uncharacterized protein LOC113359252 [Papaver somniferum]
MREAEKEKEDEGMKEPDSEADEADEDQSMSDGSNEDEAEDDWRIPIHQYLDKGTLPADVKETRKLESKAAMYNIRDGILYRRSFLEPLMRYLSQTEDDKVSKRNKELFQGKETAKAPHVGYNTTKKFSWKQSQRNTIMGKEDGERQLPQPGARPP